MKRSSATLAALLSAAILGFVLLDGTGPRDSVSANPELASSPTIDEAGISSPRERAASPPRVLPGKQALRSVDLPPDFLNRAVDEGGFRFSLPDGREARGTVSTIQRGEFGVMLVEGRLEDPEPGRFFFMRQTAEGVAGSLVGNVLFDRSEIAWKVEPLGPGGSPRLMETHRDGVLCVNYAMPPEAAAPPVNAPQDHPSDIPIPHYQEIIPLQSLPGATGVIYLDFDGEKGPFLNWGDFDAAAPGVSNEEVHLVWRMVCEDFQPFDLNITTDRKVFDAASPGRRQHVIITPTTTASPASGGVAYVGSFNWTADIPCWAFYSVGKYCAEVVSHEAGHALGLSHDGRTVPVEDYYLGHGSGETGWAPIMGAGYYENVTQWSKGEYLDANRPQDDLAIIVGNNEVNYRADDTGGDLATARYLEIAADNSVSNEGIIETGVDVDSFRFVTGGGPVTLHAAPVTANPNLDILAELIDAGTGEAVASANPDATLGASLFLELPAGEYLLAISGTGRGDPLVDGYPDYGSLGGYRISGTVTGGVKPERFTLAENSPGGTAVGSVAARNDHGSASLTWSIVAGGAEGVFTIDPQTGVITIANPDAFDYEVLSSRWDDPATFELQVAIADGETSSLNESIRVVITISDVNETPLVSSGSLTVLAQTRPGTALLKVDADDPDRFDLPTFAITAGNEDGWFGIDPGSGLISASASGIGEVAAPTLVPLTIQVTDRGSPPLSASSVVNLTVIGVPAGHAPGGLMRTYFEEIPGASVSSLTNATWKWPLYPDSEEFLTTFEGPPHGEDFGSSLRGYFIPPVSGNYRFWIASDGSSQLFLDPTADQTGEVMIASVSGLTEPRAWADFAPYRSSSFSLAAGKAYYIEALHKEGTGTDHVSVAFSGPGIPKQLLRGLYLAPFLQNYAPAVEHSVLAIAENAFAGQAVGTLALSDVNSDDAHGSYVITAGNEDGVFAIDPATGAILVSATGVLDAAVKPSYTLSVAVTDSGAPPLSGAGEITINVLGAGAVVDIGIVEQVWNGLDGTAVGDLTASGNYPFCPDLVKVLPSFDSGENPATRYGSRIRALVTPVTSGYYTFFLSSNDHASLSLGSDATPEFAEEIATVEGWTYLKEWTKYPSQQSGPVYLSAGHDYYIETLHKQGEGSSHVQVGWVGPGIPAVSVIPGNRLKPYDINVPPVFPTPLAFTVSRSAAEGAFVGSALAVDPEGEDPLHVISSGNEAAVFAINAATGVITVANPGPLAIGQYTFTVAAQDHGIGGVYPLKSASAAVVITVEDSNQAPSFGTATITAEATEDLSFLGQLSATDPDPGEVLVYSKVDGPDWLAVAQDGSIHGTPGNANVGPNAFVVRVTDTGMLSAEAELVIAVANTNDAPVFLVNPLSLAPATQDEPYQLTIVGTAVDIDAGDILSYSKASGPGWLAVASDGSLTGTPHNGNVGPNSFTVRATDAAGSFSEAALTVEVADVNDPPAFSAPVIAGVMAAEDQSYSGTLAGEGSDPDAADSLIYSKVSGPGWLAVAADGSLSGSPGNAEAGANFFVIRVTDPTGAFAEATLSITVENANDPPVFHVDPILRAGGREGDALVGGSLAEVAGDEDADEVLTFSKIEGPEWLAIAGDGSLSGTPPPGSAGSNLFTVRVTDLAGAHAEATLVMEVAATVLPLPWDEGGVGNGAPGSSTAYGAGEFHVSGAGQLAGRNDSFRFVWQPLSGDGVITARVDSMEDGGSLSRAGVMIRDTLATNSRHVFLGLGGDGNFRWVRRTGFNGNTATSSSGSASFPSAWVRLVRSGSTITAWKSFDGTAWVQIGSLNAALPETCYFGLAVSSGNPVALNEARFSHVSLTP